MNNHQQHAELIRKLDHLHTHQLETLKELKAMSAELDRLKASVAALTTSEKSLVALVKGLAQLIRDNATDPAALNAIADEIDADNAEIAAAVTENTPAE